MRTAGAARLAALERTPIVHVMTLTTVAPAPRPDRRASHGPPAGRGRRLLAAVCAVALAAVPRALEARQSGTLLAADAEASRASGSDGLAPALRGTLDGEGVVLWPGAPVMRGAAAAALIAAQATVDSLRISWQALAAVVSDDSTLGVTWGVLAGASRAGDAAPRFGRYIAAWQRGPRGWRLAALLLNGLAPAAAARVPAGAMPEWPPLPARGDAAAFIGADLAFARLAADSGAAVAFERWAADDAELQGGGGITVRGPAAIGRLVAGPADWAWYPVAAGASRDGSLGWTVGQSVITPRGDAPSHGKYLTVWRRLPDGRVRYLTDGGNARPAPR